MPYTPFKYPTMISSPEAAAARERLCALEAAGARAFAPPAYALVESLLSRGESIGGGAGARLIARAVERADALARELEDAKVRARGVLSGVSDPSGALADAVEAGNVLPVLRAARRFAPARSSAGIDGWVARLSAEARARGLSIAARTPAALAGALYASSRDELSAMLVALRAQAEVPSNAGPYNPLAIAARALAELSTLAPGYLSATVAYLDELAPLLALPSPPAERSRPPSLASRGKRPPRRSR